MKKTTVVFDLDGTLLDTLDDLTAAVNHALKKYNLPERTVTEVAAFLGNGAGKLIELSTPDGQNNPYFKDILLNLKNITPKTILFIQNHMKKFLMY